MRLKDPVYRHQVSAYFTTLVAQDKANDTADLGVTVVAPEGTYCHLTYAELRAIGSSALRRKALAEAARTLQGS